MEAVFALEVVRALAAVVRCFAEPALLDALDAPPEATALRVAADELLLVGELDAAAGLVTAAEQALVQDADALVVDASDAWESVALVGASAEEAFRRISSVPLPTARPAVAQGAVGGFGAKVLAQPDRIIVLVSSTAADCLYERALESTADLAVLSEAAGERA